MVIGSTKPREVAAYRPSIYARAWLTDGRVAWEIPRPLISVCYLSGLFSTPAGWWVTGELEGEWVTGGCGEMRAVRELAGVV